MSQNYPYQYDIHGNSYPLVPFSIYHGKEKREAIDDKASFNILGRDNFFEKFMITFDEAKKSVILE